MNEKTINRREQIQKDFNILFHPVDDIIQEYTFDSLLEPENARAFLQFYGDRIKALNLSPAATYFVSYLRGLMVALQNLMSTENAVMNWTSSNWSIVLVAKEGYTSMMFRPLDPEIVEIAPINRDEWRNKVLADFYGGTLKPLLTVLAAEAGLNTIQLWALMATSIYYYKEHAASLYKEKPVVLEQLMADYQYLISEMDGSVFGRSRNPLHIKIKFVDSPYKPGEQMPLKSSCCLAYLTEGERYCYTCPKLSKTERSKLGDEILAARA